MTTQAIRQAIVRAALEEGISPSLALSIAQRESAFNPSARNSSTIRGLFQMTGKNRSNYGIGDSDDPYTQAKGWARFIKDVGGEMRSGGGREFSGAELYAGHHFGGVRAGRMFGMDPSTPVDQVFTPREMAENPHFAKAETVGRLLGSVTSDIQRRERSFGGSTDLPDLSEFGEAVQVAGSQARPAAPATDLSGFGTPVDDGSGATQPTVASAPSLPNAMPVAMAQAKPNLAEFGSAL